MRSRIKYVDLSAIDHQQITKPQEISPKAAPSRARQKIAAGDTLFSCVRVYLENTAFVPAELDNEIASTAFAVLRPTATINPRYLYLLVRQQQFIRDMVDKQRGNSPPAVLESDVKAAIVPLAPSAEQARIAARIDELFGEIEAGEQELEKARDGLETYRRAVLKAAVTGELTKDWRAKNKPTETGADLLARILKERRAAWEKAELAKMKAKGQAPKNDAWKSRYEEPKAPNLDGLPVLPEGWVWSGLDQLAWDCSYGTSVKCSTDAKGLAVLRIPNVQSGRISEANLKYTPSEFALELSDLVRPGDFLIVRTNGSESLIGRAAACIDEPRVPAYFASYLIRFRLLEGASLWRWISLYWNSDLVRHLIGQNAATSAGQYNISQSKLVRFPVPIPAESELHQLLAVASVALDSAQDLWATLENGLGASDLRQSILSAAFAGKLVPQDPNDEPASVLLDRLRAAKAAAPELKRGSRRNSKRPAREAAE